MRRVRRLQAQVLVALRGRAPVPTKYEESLGLDSRPGGGDIGWAPRAARERGLYLPRCVADKPK